jgi:hypothetical protein
VYNFPIQECIFMCFLHDKLIPAGRAGSVAFIFMCITTKNEMKSGEKEMSFFEKAGLSKYHRRGHI